MRQADARSAPARCAAAGVLLFGALGSPLASAVEGQGGGRRANQQFRYDAKDRRDPFTPLDARLSGAKGGPGMSVKPELFGILWDPRGSSIALVDELEVKVGDPVRDFHVQEIREDAVVLKRGEEQLVLQIGAVEPESAEGDLP